MTDPFTLSGDAEDAARSETSRAIRGAMQTMAAAAGVPAAREPAWEGAQAATVPVLPAAAGIRFAVMLRDAARHEEDHQIRNARREGLTWRQIGEALRLGPVAEERGASLAEAAFGHAAGEKHARPWDRLVFTWTCRDCGQPISDHGPSGGHPEDDEPGHAAGCPRLAAAVAAWEAERGEED